MKIGLNLSLLIVLACAAALPRAARGEGLTCKKDGKDKNLLTVSRPKRTVLVYQSAPNKFKTYVKELYTPAGVQILLDSPHDHVHHHALMYAIKAEKTDFWTEGGKQSGTQRPRNGETETSFSPAKDGLAATIAQTLDWVSPGGQVVLVEQRSITVHGPAGGATLLTWRTRLSAGKAGRARLWGAHYNGLGIRFIRSMDKGGKFFNPTGKAGQVVRGDEHNVAAAWCAYTASAKGKPVTVAMFGHPKNFRGTTTWFTMTGPFSYLAATLNLHRKQHVLTAGEPIDVVYGVAVWDGKQDAAAVQKLYTRWLAAAAHKNTEGKKH